MYECQICGKYARRTLAEIMRHVRETHRHFAGPVRCGIDGCPATPSTYDGLRQHIYKRHRDALIPPFQNELDSHDNSLNDPRGDANEIASAEPPIESSPQPPARVPNKTLEAARFILKIRDGKRLTQTTTDGIIKDIQCMLDHSISDLKNNVMEVLGENLTTDLKQKVQELFSAADSKCLFDGLETQYKQEKFIQEHFQYVVSDIAIGKDRISGCYIPMHTSKLMTRLPSHFLAT